MKIEHWRRLLMTMRMRKMKARSMRKSVNMKKEKDPLGEDSGLVGAVPFCCNNWAMKFKHLQTNVQDFHVDQNMRSLSFLVLLDHFT